jgi:NADH dehydrogenase FAD-containing subunit
MSCQAAMQLGPQAAETVLRRIAGAEPVPADVGFAGQCLSLGRRTGFFQVAGRDDTAGRYFLGGRPAAMLKETICRGIVRQLAYEARRPGERRWWLRDRRRRALRAGRGEVVATGGERR